MFKSPEPLTPTQPKFLSARKLAFLLETYEVNYRKLQILVPERDDFLRLSATDEPDLFIQPIEKTPYTETLLLTYRFPEKIADSEAWQTLEEPCLVLRMFHDANVIEVLKVGEHEHVALLKEFETDSHEYSQRRWQMNMLLNKWLTYLLSRDYQIASDEKSDTQLPTKLY